MTGSRRPRMRRVPGTEPLSLTPTRRRILELLRDYRFLSAKLVAQLSAAGKDNGEKHAENQLGPMFHAGLVSRAYRATRVPGEGSDAFTYFLAPDGARLVLSPEEWREQRAAIYARGQGRQQYDHALALAALQAILTLGQDGWRLDEFTGDREHDGMRQLADVPGLGRRVIWPDAEVVLSWPGGGRQLLWFEIDRSRRSLQRTDERFRAYGALLSGPALAALKIQKQIESATVVFVADTERNQKQLTIRAHRLFSDRVIPAPWPAFVFWNGERWWSGPRLRPPSDVLSDRRIVNVRGEWRSFHEVARPAQGDVADGRSIVGSR